MTRRPKTLNEDVMPLFDAALDARNAGDLGRAKELCLEALAKLGSTERQFRAMVHGELGYIHRLLEDRKTSASHYTEAVKYSPESELGSLGLFHAFAAQGLLLDAMSEAVRFLRRRDSPEYRELFGERFGREFPPAERALVAEARELLQQHSSKDEET